MEPGTEAGTMKEYCFPTCSRWLAQLVCLYNLGLPAQGWHHLQWTAHLHQSIIKGNLLEAFSQLTFPLPRWAKLVSSWQQNWTVHHPMVYVQSSSKCAHSAFAVVFWFHIMCSDKYILFGFPVFVETCFGPYHMTSLINSSKNSWEWVICSF